MELTVKARKSRAKSEINRIRREGDIPAVVYDRKGESCSVTVSGGEFRAHLRNMEKGCLATQFFQVNEEGKTYKTLVKDITYDRTRYDILHLDLMKVNDEDEVTIHIPVLFKGDDMCVGVKEGGQLKRVKRSVKVTLKVGDIPKAFELDVTNVRLGEALRVRDLDVKEGMKVRLQDSLVLASVSK